MAPSSRTQPEQHAPPVQWLQVKYAKRGRARFTSHRDFGRAFERSLRRAGVPMAYSSGFSPHPRISYPNAAPTGAASEAEYVEIGLATMCDPDKVKDALNAALPLGLDVLDVIAAPPGALAGKLTASHWQVELPGLSAAALSVAVEAFLTSDKVPVQRMTKTGLREFDARAAVIAARRCGCSTVDDPGASDTPGTAGRHSDRPTGRESGFHATRAADSDPAFPRPSRPRFGNHHRARSVGSAAHTGT